MTTLEKDRQIDVNRRGGVKSRHGILFLHETEESLLSCLAVHLLSKPRSTLAELSPSPLDPLIWEKMDEIRFEKQFSISTQNSDTKYLILIIKLVQFATFIDLHSHQYRYSRISHLIFEGINENCTFQQTRSPRRRVTELLKRTAPYGRHSDHYDSTIGNVQLLRVALRLELDV